VAEEEIKRLCEALERADRHRDASEARARIWFETNAGIDQILRKTMEPIEEKDPDVDLKTTARSIIRAMRRIVVILETQPRTSPRSCESSGTPSP
jgi:hypothetical protein